jgi:hypothetical protein
MLPVSRTEFHLDETAEMLRRGASRESILTNNQWAAVGLDHFHNGSTAEFLFRVDDTEQRIVLRWNSNFEKLSMRETKYIAEHGGISLTYFLMSVLLGYRTVVQTEIGDGVDYMFSKDEIVNHEDVFALEGVFVEVSGIYDGDSGTVLNRVRHKHGQIAAGGRREAPSAVSVACLSSAETRYEAHKA